ncbi:MAG: hypothetical protein HY583_02285 [Candidatus Omnitrophica bacterium]|nr:hypothetical protein [Candidatus Omnitrophota bacterium]
MKKMQLAIAVLVAVFALSQGSAYAKLVGGKVVGVDTGANTITISQTNPETGAEENVVVSVNESTIYSGVGSLAEVNSDVEVWVDAEEDPATKAWIAKSVQSEVTAPAAETPAAPAEATT